MKVKANISTSDRPASVDVDVKDLGNGHYVASFMPPIPAGHIVLDIDLAHVQMENITLLPHQERALHNLKPLAKDYLSWNTNAFEDMEKALKDAAESVEHFEDVVVDSLAGVDPEIVAMLAKWQRDIAMEKTLDRYGVQLTGA